MFSSSEDSGTCHPEKKPTQKIPSTKTPSILNCWLRNPKSRGKPSKKSQVTQPTIGPFTRIFFFWIFKARADTEKPTPIGDERSDLDQKKM